MYLEDIALLSTDDAETLSALKTIKIADSAQEAERMTVQDIIRKIRPQIKVIERHCECKLQIHVPKEMTLRTLNGNFEPKKLMTRVEMAIKEYCSSCEVEIKNSNILSGSIPEKYVHWSSSMVPKELRGTTMVRVYFDDNVLSPLVYQMYVGIKKPVLKLTQPVPAGTLITMSDVDSILVDITNEVREFATVDDLHNTEIKRSLGAGEFLSLNDLILKFKVKLGDSIKVLVKNNSLEMEMSGVAQRNGRVGDKIPVRLAATRKDVTGEVLSDGRIAL
jgi:flagella basal body P-ring formation protein FlgA